MVIQSENVTGKYSSLDKTSFHQKRLECSLCQNIGQSLVYNIFLISLKIQFLIKLKKISVLIIERAQHDYLPEGILARCIEYFLYDAV